MQAELDADYPELDIQLFGVNKAGLESGIDASVEGRGIPLLQDVDANGDGASDTWERWHVAWRDVVILDGNNEMFATFNLTTYNLAEPENYNALRQLLIDATSVRLNLNDDVAVTRPETTVDVAVLANDSDSPHVNFVLESVEQPAHGSAEIVEVTYSLDPEPGTGGTTRTATMQVVRYHPDPGFIGQDSITYVATDGSGRHGSAQVAVTVSSDLPLWQNPHDALDVDCNEFVSPLDALLVINGLNQDGPGSLPTSLVAPNIPPPFTDSSGNGSLEPLDAILVINRLNEDDGQAAAAEGDAIGLIHAVGGMNVEGVSLNQTIREAADVWLVNTPAEDAEVSPLQGGPISSGSSVSRSGRTSLRHVGPQSSLDPFQVDEVLATDLFELLLR